MKSFPAWRHLLLTGGCNDLLFADSHDANAIGPGTRPSLIAAITSCVYCFPVATSVVGRESGIVTVYSKMCLFKQDMILGDKISTFFWSEFLLCGIPVMMELPSDPSEAAGRHPG